MVYTLRYSSFTWHQLCNNQIAFKYTTSVEIQKHAIKHAINMP